MSNTPKYEVGQKLLLAYKHGYHRDTPSFKTMILVIASLLLLTGCDNPTNHWVDQYVVQDATALCAPHGGLTRVGEIGGRDTYKGEYTAKLFAVCGDGSQIRKDVSWK